MKMAFQYSFTSSLLLCVTLSRRIRHGSPEKQTQWDTHRSRRSHFLQEYRITEAQGCHKGQWLDSFWAYEPENQECQGSSFKQGPVSQSSQVTNLEFQCRVEGSEVPAPEESQVSLPLLGSGPSVTGMRPEYTTEAQSPS